ncbi:MAG: lipid A deacylase LpxR family protein [Gemmatimonadaceae bacterium]|nr:lipid A deacylase LpxR family protein [Gemmatimonadaceae bacterium]NUQ93357.1 lipid A deacylase LpxR family protein [Gemmatimonadaceae bacterium]NUS96449.1 lipid A deacylase LpxR family protein [Gemmatimonadaceae bacterium]
MAAGKLLDVAFIVACRAALLVALPASAVAQSPGAARAVETVAENDLFLVRGRGAPPDYDYTHGTRARVTWSSAPGLIARAVHADSSCRAAESRAAGCVTTAAALTQDIYTPRHDGVAPVPGERPYAGWLGLSLGAARITPGVTRSLSLEAGVTGRPSLAEDAQMDIHRLVRTGPQLGWGHQLASRGTLGARYGESRRFERPAAGTRSVAAHLRWEGAVGNALTALSGGGDLEIASRDGAPWSPATPDVPHPSRLFARIAVRGDAVLRSAVIEGWRRGDAAVRRPLVAEGEIATGVRWRRYAVEYSAVLRGPEYRAAPAAHPWGSFRLTVDGY